jgi:hypothetical protein
MTLKKMTLSALFIFCLVAPLAAQSWTEDYLNALQRRGCP